MLWTRGFNKRVFIRAAAVDHWDRHFQQPEVHRQLAAMVVPVVEHYGPEHSDTRLGEDLFSAKGQSPVPLCRLFTHAAKAILRRSNTVIESGMDLFHIARSRRVKTRLGRVKLLKLRNPC